MPPTDPRALADAILRMLSEPAAAARMGDAAATHASERFSVERHIREYESLYRGLLGRNA